MTKFNEWCVETEVAVPKHRLKVVAANPAQGTHAVGAVASVIPDYYAAPKRIAELLRKFNKAAAAKYVEQKLPTSKSIKSGDLGEVLCTAYVAENTPYKLGIKRLRWKDHRNMSMRGEDVLAFSIGASASSLKVLKAEVKSRAQMTTAVLDEAREALSANQGLPSPHAVSFVADRLHETGETALADVLDDVQLNQGLNISQVEHMLFTFSGSDPTNLLKKNLSAYTGAVPQIYLGLRVEAHQQFIKQVFEAVSK